jgi:putative ABC transport system permease protein
MVAVFGVSESSKADLVSTLDRLGTNLLQVQAGQGLFREGGQLPEESADMTGRVGPVEQVATVGSVSANVLRTDLVPPDQTGGITVQSADPELLETLGGRMAAGEFLDEASSAYPVTMLGSVAAERLGIARTGVQVWLGGRWFTVGGILAPLELAPGLDRAALVGRDVAEALLGASSSPTTIFVRTSPETIDDVASVLPATVSPEFPEEVEVSRPSDALEARAAVNDAFTALFVGLGAIALLVGGVGIANVMVISVLERRSEIGLRRALGATRRHIWSQFLTESVVLGALGGVAGVFLGALVTVGYAATRGWEAAVPPYALAGGLAAAVLIGAGAGLYPALRAARLTPTEALRTV